jgi:hypothetical protein
MNTTTFYNSLFFPFLNNDNILIYNGESLPEDIKENVTRSILNLMNSCRNIYDTKIIRSPNCIWFILVKNIPDYFMVQLLKNACGMASNNSILKDTLLTYPHILINSNINYNYYNYYISNSLYNIAYQLGSSDNFETNDNFDLLR